MKKVIIGIHGLGNKPHKHLLKKWWKDAMVEGLKAQGITKDLPVFEMVYWADILYDKPLDNSEKDEGNALFMDEPYHKASETFEVEDHSFRQKVIDFITDQTNKIFLNDDKSLNYSFLTNIILKKYFKDLDVYYSDECKDENDVQCKTRDLIRERVAQMISKYQDREILIVAHSMGSIVAFDVLNYLIPEIAINTLVTIGSPLGLPVVISKIASEQKNNGNGKSIMATPPGIRKAWYNLADILDNVALKYKLGDDFKPNERNISPIDFLVQNNYEMNGEKNPHKSFGYLRTAEFTGVIDDFIGVERVRFGQKVLGKMQRIIETVKVQQELVIGKIRNK